MERMISFEICLNQNMSILECDVNEAIINNNFCTILSHKYKDDKFKKIIELFNNVDERYYNSPWKAFGYKYISFILLNFLNWRMNKNEIEPVLNFQNVLIEKLKNISPKYFSNVKKEDIKEFVEKTGETLCFNKSYLISIIENAFGIWDEKEWIGNEIHLEKKQVICEMILAGVKEFAENYNYDGDYSIIENTISEIIFQYLSDDISKYDELLIQQIPIIKAINNKQLVYPLIRRDKYTIGIVNPWPGDKSAEAEVLSRMKVGAEDIGLRYIMLDNFGHILDDATQKKTDQFINPKELEFVITTHYDSEKTVDAFYYHTLWNPPEIPLNLGDYDTRITNNYLMNDDYLIYDFGGMSNHLKGILMNKPRTLKGASMLTASFPKSRILEPKLENPKLFYCGMNWEKVVHNSNRHEGLFKLLDETGNVKFFGPDKVEAWGGLRPWAGYKCYQYPIPFDGFSILKEINDCGICLVLSSDIHRRAGAATNRTYEACAAGAIIITDNNEFMQFYFKEAALFIDYNKNNPTDTFKQIMEKYNWIIEHKSEAIEMAKRSQKIFIENFAVDKQLLDVINNHSNRLQTVSKDLFANNESGRVLVSFVVNSLNPEDAKEMLGKVIDNIKNQYYRNIVLGIICDKSIKNETENFVYSKGISFNILSLELFDNKKSRQYTDGQVIRILQNNIKHDFFINIFAHEVWFYDHLTTLVRTIQEENACCAYSGRLHKDTEEYSRCDFFGNIHISTVFYMNCPDWLPVPGQILFKQECHNYMPDFLFDCLDGYEHNAYLGVLWIKHKQKIAFTKRMTSIWSAKDIDKRCSVLRAEYQIRFIKDLVRFYLPEGFIGGSSGVSSESIKQYMQGIPVRAWLKLRTYKVLLRIIGHDSKMGKSINKKYFKSIEQFNRW